MQSRKGTIIEIATNTGIGLVGSWLITYIVLHYKLNPATTATITCVLCTIWSIVRNYGIRRYFNGKKL